MASNPTLEYQSLSSPNEQIRTLILFAGSVNSAIRCSLETVSLLDTPAYDALSYTWGDPGATKAIEVDGFQFQATLNLVEALRHLRHLDKDLVLWVDAICINQLDLREKSYQVALMGRIYRQCTQVRVWLGCETVNCGLGFPINRESSAAKELDSRQDPFELINHLAQDRHIWQWPCFRVCDDSGKVVFEDSDSFNRAWGGFRSVINCPWWTRMWTVQEAILPTTGTLTYDTWSTSLETITSCGTNFYNHVWGCCRQASAALPDALGDALDGFCAIFYTLDQDRNSLANDEYFDIQEQNISYGVRQCHNPRDKVYGLLGIIGDITDLDIWLTPNYNVSEHEVFYDITKAMLYRDLHSLKCLTGAQCGPAKGKWASWVRDFNMPLSQLDVIVESNRLMLYTLFNASGGKKSRFEHYTAWPRHGDTKAHQVGLRVNGRHVGVVASIFQEVGSHGTDLVEVVAHQQKATILQWAQAALGMDIATFDIISLRSAAVEKFLRTVLGGAMSTGKNDEYSDWRLFNSTTMAWLGPFSAWLTSTDIESTLALDRTLLIANHGRCFFKSEKGDQGLCYPTTRIGDEVWVIDGSKVPFILRDAELDNEEQVALRPWDAYELDEEGDYRVKKDYEPGEALSGYYELIGDCYFDSYMHGEAVLDTSLHESSIVLV